MSQYTTEDLLYLMRRLREPETGCPWDLAQTFSTIAPHTLEECYELVDAIETGDSDQVRQELGDVLFQVVFYAQLAQEQQGYDFNDIVHELVAKLVRRHPHVFASGQLREHPGGDTEVAEVKENWERIKQEERRQKNQLSILDDIPRALPAVLRAVKLQKRAARTGFDWPTIEPVFDKIQEELREVRDAPEHELAGEVGDLLFACINLARHLGVEPEQALRSTNQRFEQRFRFIEKQLAKDGRTPADSNLSEMDELWSLAKSTERSANTSD